jgi:NADH:ubiquinone oxidoreductase subunit 5 (subunit L)/multisubunit Na+/H+ antiporter MnhA subunit
MSKWIVITVSMVLVTVGIIFGALVYFLKKNQAEEDAADEIFLRSKSALLNNAVSEQLKTSTVAVEGNKVLANSKVSQQAIGMSNTAIAAALAAKQKVIDDLRRKYETELSKIKNK